VVCSYNGAATIGESLQRLNELRYPNFETIVVDDGSTNNVSEIARQSGASRVIRVPNGGLSRARNVGFQVATGEIVAYIDDDAYPDPHWLHYLAHTFMTTDYAAVGGPNIPPPGDGRVADCVARSPGGPTHVLVSDREAEHIPGCNMAFRKACLEKIGGFDPQFRVAGDDVDVCWSLQQQGWKLGFNPAAVVWHHRRSAVRAYWKQQQGYGKAEALLEKKWPEKYNIVGHPTWRGRVYGNGHGWTVGRVYHGVWGSAPFQSLYERGPGMLRSMLLMPEWFLLVIVLSALSAIGFAWNPLLAAVPLLTLSTAVTLVQAVRSARRSGGWCKATAAWQRTQQQGVVACLHVIQPMARLWGRLRHGITPWRLRGRASYGLPWPRTPTIWSERWRSEEDRLRSIENSLRSSQLLMVRGGEYDRWELEGRGGPLGAARLRMVLEEHGAGRQLVRFRIWPKISALVTTLICIFAGLTIWAVLDNAALAAIALAAITFLLVSGTLQQCAAGMGGFLHTLAVEEESERAAILAAAGVPASATAAGPQVAVNGAAGVVPASSWTVSSESARETLGAKRSRQSAARAGSLCPA
jgi:O-antigen biosynthesis protein